MARTLEEIREEALQLTDAERGQLAEELWDTLAEPLRDPEIDRKWAEVAHARYEELRSGAVKGLTLEEFLSEDE